MSSIPVYSELILRRDGFIADLRGVEAEVQASMARIGAMGAQFGGATQIGRMQAVESEANAELESASEGFGVYVQEFGTGAEITRDAAEGYNVYVQEFGTGAETTRDAAEGFRIYVQEFGAAVEEIRTAAAEMNAGAAGGPGAGGAGAGADVEDAEAGEVTAATREGGGGMGRYGRIAGMLVAHYGISQLMERMSDNAKIEHLGEDTDVTDQARKAKEIADSYRDSFSGRLAQNLSEQLPDGIVDSPEEIAATASEAYRNAKKEDRTSTDTQKGNKQFTSDQQRLTTELEGVDASVREKLKEQADELEQFTNKLRGEGRKGLANQLDAVGKQLIALDQAKADREKDYRYNETGIDLQAEQSAANVAGLRGQGRDREASRKEQEDAVNNRLNQARANLQKMQTGTPEYADAYAKEQGQELAAQAELKTIKDRYDRQTQDDAQKAADAVSDINAQAHVRDLRAAGQYEEAATAERHAAIEKRARDAQEAADKADPTLRPGLQKVADTLKGNVAADEKVGDDDAAYKARMAEELKISAFVRQESAARLSMAKNDYVAETAEFKRQWDERLKAIQDAKIPQAEKDKRTAAAKADEAAEKAAMDAQHVQRHEDSLESTQSDTLRAMGQGKLADLDDFAQQTKDKLAAAGDDPEARKDVLENAKAKLQQMAAAQFHPQTYGSVDQYDAAVQQEAIGGQGDALKQIQDFFTALNKTENATDRAAANKLFDDGAKSLQNAADAIIKSQSRGNVLILTDNG